MEWLAGHADSVIVLGSVVGSALWMTKQISHLKLDMEQKLNRIDRRLIRIETALMLHGILPGSNAGNDE